MPEKKAKKDYWILEFLVWKYIRKFQLQEALIRIKEVLGIVQNKIK